MFIYIYYIYIYLMFIYIYSNRSLARIVVLTSSKNL